MAKSGEKKATQSISRREALKRLGLSAAAAYLTPTFSAISIANASSGSSGGGSAPSGGGGSAPSGGGSAPSAPSAPSGPSAAGGAASGASGARAAVRGGNALPLRQVLKEVRAQTGGRVLGFTFRNRKGRPVYNMRILGKNGKLIDAVVDARNGSILQTKGR